MPTKENEHTRKWHKQRWILSLLLLGIATLGALVSILTGIFAPAETSSISFLTDSSHAETTLDGSTPKTIDPPAGDLYLVNAEHPWASPESGTLVSVYAQKLDGYNVRDTDIFLEQRLMEPLNRMLGDFLQFTGNENLLLCAGYRTREEQQALWDRAVETKGEQHANSYLARPGTSEHHTGLAVDFSFYDVSTGASYDFDGSGDSAWILEHCWEYGFVQRYPEGKAEITGISTEPWHFRYVGLPHAYLMRENNFCLEEYLTWLRQYPYDGEHLTADCGGKCYEIWYCPADDLQCSGDGTYTISGDNCGGAVITLETA